MLSIKGDVGLNKKNWKKEFEILAETMDKQYTFHRMLKDHFPTIEDCPEKWKPDWIAGNKSGWINWRTDKKIVRRIKSAAKKKCNV